MWSYNDIDVYITPTENVLGEVSVDTNNWTALSLYGLVRGRPKLTPSTVTANGLEIPGRDGTTYQVDSRRGNAKIEFEILIADEWVHRQLEREKPEIAGLSVRQRTDIVFSLCNLMKRVAWKCPGRDADSYFLVYKVKLTPTDGYDVAQVIKVELEVHPFEWFFEGNQPLTTTQGSLLVENPIPFSRCMPVYIIKGAGHLYIGSQSTGITATAYGNNQIVIDTWKEMVYVKDSNPVVNANRYVSGDLSNLWIFDGETVTIMSDFSEDVTVYTRKGIIR